MVAHNTIMEILQYIALVVGIVAGIAATAHSLAALWVYIKKRHPKLVALTSAGESAATLRMQNRVQLMK